MGTGGILVGYRQYRVMRTSVFVASLAAAALCGAQARMFGGRHHNGFIQAPVETVSPSPAPYTQLWYVAHPPSGARTVISSI